MRQSKYKKHRAGKKRNTVTRFLFVVAFLSIVALSGLYVFQVNAKVTEEYLMRDYERKIGEITQENKHLAVRSVEANTLDSTLVLLGRLDFERADNIHYIRVLGNQVVVK